MSDLFRDLAHDYVQAMLSEEGRAFKTWLLENPEGTYPEFLQEVQQTGEISQ